MARESEVSAASRTANQGNAGKSTGPRTVEGKRASSRNALKHGLTARDVVLPNESPEDYQAHLDQWLDHYRPTDPAQLALIERAVVARWRLDRCGRVEAQRLAERVRHAEDRYDLERLAEAEEVGRRLVFEPINRAEPPEPHDPAFAGRLRDREDAHPAVLSRQLQATAQGVRWLLDRWAELAGMLERHGFWHYPEKFRAVYLLGRRPEDVLDDPLVHGIFLACHAAHAEPGRTDFWEDCFQAKLGVEGKAMYFVQVDAIKALSHDNPETARAKLWEIVRGEVARLRTLVAGHLDPLDRLDRDGAAGRAMFDGGPEATLLRRYETACERELHRSIAGLVRLRKEPLGTPGATDSEAVVEDSAATQDTPLQNEPIAEVKERTEVATREPAGVAVPTPKTRAAGRPPGGEAARGGRSGRKKATPVTA